MSETNDIDSGREKIDSILAYVFLKTIMTNPSSTEAYQLGLIDQNGNVLRDSINSKERNALTVLDKIGFKLRRMLGARISELSSFAYIKSTHSKYQTQLSSNSVEKKAMIKRVMRDIKTLTETHSMDFEDVARIYLNEEMKDYEG